jgi:hypothetical protein
MAGNALIKHDRPLLCFSLRQTLSSKDIASLLNRGIQCQSPARMQIGRQLLDQFQSSLGVVLRERERDFQLSRVLFHEIDRKDGETSSWDAIAKLIILPCSGLRPRDSAIRGGQEIGCKMHGIKITNLETRMLIVIS